MKIKAIFIAVIAIIVLVILVMPQSFRRESVRDVQALWNEDKLYITIEKHTVVQQQTCVALRLFSGLMGTHIPRLRVFPDDLIIIQVTGNRIENREYRQIGRVGGIFPVSQDIYFMKGSDPVDYPYLSQLTQDGVKRVPKEEALKIIGLFKLQSEFIERQGWHKLDIDFREGVKEYPIQMNTNSLTLVLSAFRSTGLSKMELKDERVEPPRTLFQQSGRARQIKSAEIRQLESKSD